MGVVALAAVPVAAAGADFFLVLLLLLLLLFPEDLWLLLFGFLAMSRPFGGGGGVDGEERGFFCPEQQAMMATIVRMMGLT